MPRDGRKRRRRREKRDAQVRGLQWLQKWEEMASEVRRPPLHPSWKHMGVYPPLCQWHWVNDTPWCLENHRPTSEVSLCSWSQAVGLGVWSIEWLSLKQYSVWSLAFIWSKFLGLKSWVRPPCSLCFGKGSERDCCFKWHSEKWDPNTKLKIEWGNGWTVQAYIT